MSRYAWARRGDLNAFFGLMLDNVTVMILLVTLISKPVLKGALAGYFTSSFVMTWMIPGTAFGVFLGDLIYTWMAFRLARRSSNAEVTAMPLGLDTPSTFGVAFLILMPTFQKEFADLGNSEEAHTRAMFFAWHVGLLVLVFVGLFKVICSPFGNAVRRWVPRAGLLGSLAAIAIALIAFLPLVDVVAVPIVGLVVLTVILITLIAHHPLPWQFPGALAAVAIGLVIFYGCRGIQGPLGLDLVPPVETANAADIAPPPMVWPSEAWTLGWWERVFLRALELLPIALPFALATIVGGIDCTESAAAAGDEYDTRTVLLTEGFASVVAGLFGGVIQNTPYIGHPAYKAMGGRAAYTLATAIFIGAAGYFGWFTHLFAWLPREAMYPILIFVGLEITAQTFRATDTRHYPALALATLPAFAYLGIILFNRAYGPMAKVADPGFVQTLRCLANGFIVTSLLWAASLAALLDGRYVRSAVYLLLCAGLTLIGVIHSPLSDAVIDLPHHVLALVTKDFTGAVKYQTPYHWAGAYLLAAGVLFLMSRWHVPASPQPATE